MTSTTSPGAVRIPFGELPDGTAIEAVELSNGRGLFARVMTYGATLQSLCVPDREGVGADIVLAYASAADYVKTPAYFGSTVGRYANRIANAAFTLDGAAYTLAKNNGANAIHGGVKGFDKRVWRIQEIQGGAAPSVTLERISADGEEGYPGALRVEVAYSLNAASELAIAYTATADKPTIVNLTNHSFFNLGGAACARSVLGHRLMIAADAITPIDAGLIPTGEMRKVAGTAFDFRESARVGARIRDGSDPQIVFARGYDHNFVLRGGGAPAPKLAARLEDPVSGRVLELLTTEPGVQFYSGNFLGGLVTGKGGVLYRQGDGLCLEPQRFPDSPNRPEFPSARLDPGETYRQLSVFRFSTVGN